MTTDKQELPELLRCPFCPDGGDPYMDETQPETGQRVPDYVYTVVCDKCGSKSNGYKSKEWATDAWNTRPAKAEDNKGKGDVTRIKNEVCEHFDGAIQNTHSINLGRFICNVIDHLAAAGFLSSPQVSVPDADKARMDWLERQHVEVRTPARYGSWANFHTSPDLEEETSDLRERVDSAIAQEQAHKGGE